MNDKDINKNSSPQNHPNICPNCGERVFPGDELNDIPALITKRQRNFIIASLFVLLLIAITFQGAEERANRAAEKVFAHPIADIINTESTKLGLAKEYGKPIYELGISPKRASLEINFPEGKLSNEQAAVFANNVCADIARAYVKKGYMPRMLKVEVSSGKAGERTSYGRAIYNGNIDALGWQNNS